MNFARHPSRSSSAHGSLEQGLGVVRKNYEFGEPRSIPAEAVEQRMGLISGSTDKHDFADCDIVIEAVFEDMALKQTIFAEPRPDSAGVIASSTWRSTSTRSRRSPPVPSR